VVTLHVGLIREHRLGEHVVHEQVHVTRQRVVEGIQLLHERVHLLVRRRSRSLCPTLTTLTRLADRIHDRLGQDRLFPVRQAVAKLVEPL
jgi:hypothetical protein